MTAALVHIIDNAAKYICPDTQLNIEFHDSPNYVDLTFNMTSLKITDDDFENIHIEGYSGELPRQLEIAGDGIGMSVIPTLLKLNSATLKIFRNVDQSKSKLLDSIEYENNIINVRIKK
jgi:signal transduction histidine kinase